MLGVDGRQTHIDQSNLVFDAKGVDPSRYRFELADIFQLDLSDEAPFDVVLCLGLLYHVSKPFELFERISAWNADLLVVDTAISSIGGPFFRIVGQDLDEPRSAVDRAVALHPSGEAVTRLAEEFGYTSAVMLRPRFTSWEGAASYKSGRRRAFMCSKHTALEGLDTEPVRVRGEKRKRSAAATGSEPSAPARAATRPQGVAALARRAYKRLRRQTRSSVRAVRARLAKRADRRRA